MPLIALLRSSGLRRSEVVNLNLKDFNPKTGAMDVIGGKGGKDGTVYLNEQAIAIVESWLNIRGTIGEAFLQIRFFCRMGERWVLSLL